MKFLLLTLVVFILINSAFAVETDKKTPSEIGDQVFGALATLEIERMKAGLKAWKDSEVIAELSKKDITEDLIKGIYQNFKDVIVDPPNPDIYTEYAIENAEESLAKTELLGRLFHNLLLSFSEEDFAKYGRLVGLMRSTLYFDTQHIPLAIRHDNSRDAYWYEVHTRGVKAVDEEYLRLFGSGKEDLDDFKY